MKVRAVKKARTTGTIPTTPESSNMFLNQFGLGTSGIQVSPAEAFGVYVVWCVCYLLRQSSHLIPIDSPPTNSDLKILKAFLDQSTH